MKAEEYVWSVRGENEGRSYEHKYTGTRKGFVEYFETLLALYPENTYTIKRLPK